MPKDVRPELIEGIAGKVAVGLACYGIRADQRVTVIIEPAEPDDWISKARAYARPKVGAGAEQRRYRPHHQGNAQSRAAHNGL